jgi:Ca-activated chloride channel family protein
MRKTAVLFAVALASIAAAAVAALLRTNRAPSLPPTRHVAVSGSGTSALRLTTQLDRKYLNEQGGGEAYLQIDLASDAASEERHRVAVNAVLILDRSGSMAGEKIERARDAARALVQSLGADDRLSIVEFSSSASVLVPSTAVNAAAREAALAAVDRLYAGGGTNMSSAFDLAVPQLAAGRAQGRIDKVFLASDGQANEGVFERHALLQLAMRDFEGSTLSTFGLGEDYDENFMNALAAQGGGRARFVASPEILSGAFHDELMRAASVVAREVRVRVQGLAGATVERVLGYELLPGGWVRLPDFAAGEERRVLAKLALPANGRGETELAAVELSFADARGDRQHAQATAAALFTREAQLLSQPLLAPAIEGAKMEMAEMAQKAAELRESGRADEARLQIMSLHKVAAQAVAAAPALAGNVAAQADSYDKDVSAISRAGDASAKKLKERAFDAARAPVAGW